MGIFVAILLVLVAIVAVRMIVAHAERTGVFGRSADGLDPATRDATPDEIASAERPEWLNPQRERGIMGGTEPGGGEPSGS